MSTIVIPCSQAGQPDVVIPTCLFGSCNMSLIIPQCECNPGFVHDRVTGRYNNCGMPFWLPYVGTSLAIAINLLSFLYGAYVCAFRSAAKTLAWRVAFSASLCSLTFCLASISLFASAPDFEMPWYGAVLIDFGAVLTAYAVGIMVVIALAPVAKFSNSKFGLKFFTRFMMKGLPGFMLVGCVIATTVGYAMNDEQAVTDAMGAIYVILALSSLLAGPIMGVHMHKFVKALDDALKRYDDLAIVPMSEDGIHSSDTPDSPILTSSPRNHNRDSMGAQHTSATKLRFLRVKVWRLMITSTVCAFAAFVVCVYCAASQFAARTVPLSFSVFFAIINALGLFSFQLSHSAVKQRANISRNNSVGNSRRSKQSDAGL